MEDPRWLRLITIGLVLAALAVGYFLFTGRLASKTTTKVQASPSASILGQNIQATPTPVVTTNPSPTPVSAYNAIASRTQNTQSGTQTLPNTGFPEEVLAILAISVMISGWGLRKFPH